MAGDVLEECCNFPKAKGAQHFDECSALLRLEDHPILSCCVDDVALFKLLSCIANEVPQVLLEGTNALKGNIHAISNSFMVPVASLRTSGSRFQRRQPCKNKLGFSYQSRFII